ncbi:MAG: DPP IV N-terminal domain-containing protein, partial [Candidatus Amulumruptor sp.]|nr:DPP IV N-terminal domain-containing protein [Candidatus Amulumruptor sp.]
MILRHLSTVIIALAAVISASAATSDYAPNNKNRFAGIEKYTGWERAPRYPARYNYEPDGKTYLQLSTDGRKLVKFDTRSGKELETILDLGNTRETTLESIQGYKVSDRGDKILVWRNSRSIYRRSFDAEYYVYEVRTRQLRPLSTDHKRQRAPIISPDGRMVAFVAEDNNIYLKKLDYWTEIAVTTDGKINSVINGVPDWVYEEEFTPAESMTWSPDNAQLCFIRYDE